MGGMSESKVVPIRSRAEAAELVQQMAHWTAMLGIAAAAQNADIQKAREKHQSTLDHLSAEITKARERLKFWAEENREEFGEAKSLEFPHGSLQFRTGQRKLVLLSRWDWEDVLKSLLATPATSQWREYVRNTPEVNKRRLLDVTKDGGKLPEARLREIGLRVVREENFEVECKPEDAVAEPPML
jgi:phage host-nuclease inhibitor protein Gam